MSARRIHRRVTGDDGAALQYDASVELPLPEGEAPVVGMASASEILAWADGRTVACGSSRARRFTIRRH